MSTLPVLTYKNPAGYSMYCVPLFPIIQCRHNGRESVSNHQLHDCLLNHLFRHRPKKTSKLRVTGLCAGNSPVNSPHKWPVTRKKFPFDDVIMKWMDDLSQSRAIWIYTFPIAVKFDRLLDSVSADPSVEFQSQTMFLTPNSVA